MLLPDLISTIPSIFKKRYSHGDDQESFQIDNGTLPDAIIKALNNRKEILELRILAHSTSVIYNVMASYLLEKIYVRHCELILRKFQDENIGHPEQSRIEENIELWRALQRKKRIDELLIYLLKHELTDYAIIIDHNIVITGIYIKDSNQQSGISFKHMYYLNAGENTSGLIESQIAKFDKLKGDKQYN